MGFWQNLVESYDKNADALKKKYPLSSTSISNKSNVIGVVVIDGSGIFVRADQIEKESKATKKNSGKPLVNITIPASEESLKRTSTAILPYPVFDQFDYLKGISGWPNGRIDKFYNHCSSVRKYIKILQGKGDAVESRMRKWKDYGEKIKSIETCGRKYDAYIMQLKGFAESQFATEQVRAIYRYVSKRTIASDLSEMNLKDKTNIIFQVEMPGYPPTNVWEDRAFFDGWHKYYLAEKEKSGKKAVWSLDYITGIVQPTATFHPKKIFSNAANAKLISSNDQENYTFRGKFSEPFEAVSIGYESSQKAHQFLRYLINDRGYSCGEQVIFSFTIDSTKQELPPPVEDKSLSAFLQEAKTQTESDVQIALSADAGVDFADALNKALSGFGYGKVLEKHAKTAVIALDSATDGRLAITFYRALDRTDYLKKIADWHGGCKWNLKFWDKENKKYVPYLGAPSADKIIEAVYGKPRSGEDEGYVKIKKAARERLLRCIFDGAFLPTDYVVAAVRRASNPLGFSKDSEFDRNGFEQMLSTACALVRKDYQQRNKEGFKLSIELDRTDRDYLYGRLLGAADKLEEYALKKKDNARVVTASIRHMQTFCQRPFRTWQTIHGCLNPYIQALKGGFAFQEIEAIKNKFVSVADYEKDAPLNGSYLIGYYHERAYIDSLVRDASSKKQLTEHNEEESNDDEQ